MPEKNDVKITLAEQRGWPKLKEAMSFIWIGFPQEEMRQAS